MRWCVSCHVANVRGHGHDLSVREVSDISQHSRPSPEDVDEAEREGDHQHPAHELGVAKKGSIAFLACMHREISRLSCGWRTSWSIECLGVKSWNDAVAP